MTQKPLLWSTVKLAVGAAAVVGREALQLPRPLPELRVGEELMAVRLCYDDYRSTELRGEVPMSYLVAYGELLPQRLKRRLEQLPKEVTPFGKRDGGVRVLNEGNLSVRVLYPDDEEAGMIVIEWPLKRQGCTLSFCIEGLGVDDLEKLVRLER